MKQLLLSILMMHLPLLANADAVEINGIYYNLSTETNTAEVTYAPDYYSGDIVIPETVNYEGMSYSVTSIGEYAFFRCSDLTSITIPNSVTSIGYYAFYGCSSLTSITIPDGVTFISKSVFSNCENLVAIIVENGNPIYDSRNNCNAIIRTADNELIAGCKTTVIPNSVTSIGIEAFSFCSLLTSIIIPSSVTSIADYAFDSCSSLTSISIPNSVTTIGEYAFQYCSGLTSVIVGNSVTSIGEYAFKNCSSLTSISIPKSVTSIGRYAFSGCSGLTSVTIPESVISIGDRAFEGTAWYESQPDGLVYAGKVAYQYKGTMPDNTSITLKEGTLVVADGAFRGCSSLTSIEIPNSVTSIGYAAFRECIGLTSITIPNSITTIGKHAFYDCSSLTDVSLSEGLISIGEEAFHTCAISTISLPQSLIRIGEQAFEQCRQLTSITLPKNVAYLGNADYIDSYGEMQEEDDLYGDVFHGCDLLADVKVDELNQAYTSVEGLLMTKDMKTLLYIPGAKTEVVVPEGIGTIHRGASSSDNLTTITLPKSLRSIEEGGFEYSNGVTSITSKMEVPATLGNYNFSYKVYNNATLYVPAGTKSKYEATDGWKDFKNIVEMGSNSPIDFADATVKAICVEHWDTNGDGMLSYEEAAAVTDLGSAFSYNKEITSFDELQYFTGLTSIGEETFYCCSGLTSISVPRNVTSIGERAFSACTRLKAVNISDIAAWCNISFSGDYSNPSYIMMESNPLSYAHHLYLNGEEVKDLVIPNGVTSIGDYAFWKCYGVISVTIPNSVTTIGCGAFRECKGIISVTIPNNLISVEDYAFWHCNGLKAVNISDITTWCNISFNGEYSNPLCHARHLFLNGTEINDLVIPNSVASIGSWAFVNCLGLTSISIPNSVTSIEEGAFSGCRSLTSISIPGNVTTIGSNAFYDCSGLTSVTISNGLSTIGESAFQSCSGLTSISIPSSVTSIGKGAFSWCNNITTIKVDNGNIIYDSRNNCNAIIKTTDNELIVGCKSTVIPESVTSIGSYAFSGCRGLTSDIIPNNVTYIGEGAFAGCSGLTSITIPSSMTIIERGTFSGCSGLTSVTIPNSVTYIGELAFWNCSSLTSVVIPNSVIYIEDAAFSDCSGIISLTISNNVYAIGVDAFFQCSGLTSITIPKSVRYIGEGAFKYCSGLTSVTSLLDMPFPIGNYVFEGCDNATLYVPVGTKSKYETIDGWKNFKNIVEMDLLPVDNGQTIDFGTDIDENTNLNGNIMDNVFVNVNNGDGSYDPSEGCIIVSKPTDDSAIDGKEIFGEDFKDNYTGIVFKLAPGEGTIKVEAQTTGNMVLKVKIGDGMPITMELEGKLKVSFPYNVSEDTYVYIYGGLNTSNNAKGMRRVESADGTLKIYGIEVDSKANDIESLEVSQDDISTIYNLNGHRINSLQRGVNIIRMNDGTVRKVVVK